MQCSLTGLVEAMTRRGTVFILGAGASWPAVPTWREMLPAIRAWLTTHVRGFAGTLTRGPLSHAISPTPADVEQPDHFCMAKESTFRLAVDELIVPAQFSRRMFQYEVFNFVPAPKVLLNFNVDGLASTICRQHSIVEMHGRQGPGLGVVMSRKERVWASQVDDLPVHSLSYYPPIREVHRLGATDNYGAYERALGGAERVVIVGYSFGGGDDWIAREILVGVIRWKPRAVLLVGPQARDLAEALADDCRASCFAAMRSPWYSVARALIEVMEERGIVALAAVGPHLEEVRHRMRSEFPAPRPADPDRFAEAWFANRNEIRRAFRGQARWAALAGGEPIV